MGLQSRVWDIYSFIKDNLYFCRNDVSIRNIELNSTLLFGILTSLTGGKELIFGEYGTGKTTSSENIISLFYSIPREVIIAAELKGNPELTEEKIIGRPNLGEMNKGVEKVVWSNFVLVGPKIIDEINRVPSSKQNILLEGTDRGIWKYLSEVIDTNNGALYATANYSDSGNTELIPPLLDRFDVAMESKHPGQNNLRLNRILDNKNVFRCDDISQKIFSSLSRISNTNYAKIRIEIDNYRQDYRSILENRTSLKIFSDAEMSAAGDEISKIGLSLDGMYFFDLVNSELSSCQIFGQKRTNENCKDNCTFSEYLCNKVSSCLSVRSDKSILRYSAALAWMLADKAITPEHLSFVIPYAVWHKTQFKPDYVESFSVDDRNDPLQLYVAKKSIEELKMRFSKTHRLQEKITSEILKKNYSAAELLIQDNPYPVLIEYMRM